MSQLKKSWFVHAFLTLIVTWATPPLTVILTLRVRRLFWRRCLTLPFLQSTNGYLQNCPTACLLYMCCCFLNERVGMCVLPLLTIIFKLTSYSVSKLKPYSTEAQTSASQLTHWYRVCELLVQSISTWCSWNTIV